MDHDAGTDWFEDDLEDFERNQVALDREEIEDDEPDDADFYEDME